jgi:uncharacterized membrane protein YdbT with pleckstrin-like domain
MRPVHNHQSSIAFHSSYGESMADILIRPSFKFIQAGYIVIALLSIALGVLVYMQTDQLYGFFALLLLVWPVAKHVGRLATKLTIQGDKLRYDVGLLSKTTRTIQLSKVQDVTVRQSLGQRMVGVGDVSIETAGETSRLTIDNIDDPQQVADKIMEIAQQGSKATHV